MVTKMNQVQEHVTILGTAFIPETLEGMTKRLVGHIEEVEKAFVVTANPEIALHAYENEEYRRIIQKATYVTADGIGIVKAAKWSNQHLPERVAGFDLFMGLLHEANLKGYRVYLLGARPEVFDKAKQKIKADYPNITLAGGHHGYFDLDDKKIGENVKASKPDLVFVALGFPRQEEWIAKEIGRMEQGVFIGIGGSFDVLAGEVKRAPKAWQKLNLEWLYRLLSQPTRITRMLALPKFVLKVKREQGKSSG